LVIFIAVLSLINGFMAISTIVKTKSHEKREKILTEAQEELSERTLKQTIIISTIASTIFLIVYYIVCIFYINNFELVYIQGKNIKVK
jgi:hypothetical protein